jgi:hypothetical protein
MARILRPMHLKSYRRWRFDQPQDSMEQMGAKKQYNNMTTT